MSEAAESAQTVANGDSQGAPTEHSEASQPAPGSAASLRPVPGQPPRSAAQREADSQQPEGKKEESRYERTKREKAEFRAQQQAFQRERQAFAEERAKFEEAKKPKRNYTLAQLKEYRQEWAREAQQGIDGREELVRKADQAIAEMEAEEKASKISVELPKFGTPEHRKIWEDSEAQIRQEDPDFGTPGTRIDQKLREILNGQNAQMYRDHPYGIFAAYAEAQKEILKEDVATLRKENESLKAENAQLQGLTSIGGGVPGRIGGKEKDFASLTSAEMRKRLLAGRSKNEFLPML